jgi:glycosyltransferase involved in cell wall biosynthesis
MAAMRPAAPISVVVPARNEESSLAVLLDSLLAQRLPPTEIVVADGGSTDRTLAVAGWYADRGVRVLELGPAYPGRGRNAAAAAARCEWIAFVDAGCTADPGWLEALWEAARGRPVARAVFGDYEPRLGSEWDVAQALALVPPRDPATGCRPWSIASALIHRAAWSAAGGFPEELRAAEDLRFFDGLHAAGVVVERAPRALVHWSLARSPREVLRRLRLYSRHHAAAGLAHTWHHRVMAMDVAGLTLLGAGVVWPPAAALAGLAALARVLRTVFTRRRALPGAGAWRPDRLARAAWLLCLADAAAWLGYLDWKRGPDGGGQAVSGVSGP